MEVCDALRAMAAASDIEEMAQYEVAQEIEWSDRLLDDAEIEDIVSDVVSDEAIADPLDSIEDGVVNMTDAEWENVPDTDKVIDTDGDESIVIEGRIYKVSLRKDDRVQRIASKISREIESFWNLRNAATGIAIDRESYKKKSADADIVCPDCGSYNQTLVWYDGDNRYWHCNWCGGEYETPADAYDASVEEITTEDIPIYEDEDDSVFGSVFYDGELGWTWQIWHNGECIEQDIASDVGEAYGIFNTVKREYEGRAAGEVLKSTIDGESLMVDSVEGGNLVCDGGDISRAQAAVDIALGRVYADNSDVYGFDIEAGDCYKNIKGEEIEVVTANGQAVLYLANEMDAHTHDYRTEYRTANRNAFVGYLVDNGYLS